jgi:hypothetical protein
VINTWYHAALGNLQPRALQGRGVLPRAVWATLLPPVPEGQAGGLDADHSLYIFIRGGWVPRKAAGAMREDESSPIRAGRSSLSGGSEGMSEGT